jgi:hypothetical protein
MQRQSVGAFWERWVAKESTRRRRSLVSAIVVAAALLVWAALVAWAGTDGPLVLLAAAVVIFGAGVFARSWLALLTGYAAAVLMFWVVEIGTFLWIGAAEWEERNADHWQGDTPVAEKLIGQLIEYAFFGLFLIPIIALGVALGRAIDQQHHDRDLEHSGA